MLGYVRGGAVPLVREKRLEIQTTSIFDGLFFEARQTTVLPHNPKNTVRRIYLPPGLKLVFVRARLVPPQCWCGEEGIDLTVHGPSDDCDYACNGDARQTCGGFNAMSVWEF